MDLPKHLILATFRPELGGTPLGDTPGGGYSTAGRLGETLFRDHLPRDARPGGQKMRDSAGRRLMAES